MNRSIAAVAVTASIMAAGAVGYLGGAMPAFAARGQHAAQSVNAVPAAHTVQVRTAEETTIDKFQWGPYVITVRRVDDGQLPKQFSLPKTLSSASLQRATVSELATLRQSYKSLATDCVQVYMPKAAVKGGSASALRPASALKPASAFKAGSAVKPASALKAAPAFRAGARSGAKSALKPSLAATAKSVAKSALASAEKSAAGSAGGSARHTRRLKAHARLNTGFGGLAKLVAHHYPAR
jgi:hypothetical protein